MSSMKGGFSTLNRWFGRKKDKSGVGNAASNGKLSKSTTQLHHLSTDTNMHINEASQLDYNRITPLPVATSNAPFEQTFRITVLLPKDQLYVARLGARVPLSKLLSLVCDNKQLDADKYEFRNPVDASQVYSCESTIGAVGLSEIRLCHKSESYDSFNADSMLKFQRTVAARDSLSSSSDFSSSRHSQSKLTLAKTPSPYSSSNSLNSMDSTGMNYTRTPVVPPKALAPPPRKKRVAPRPPSQLVIPEQSVAQFNAERDTDKERGSEPAYAVIVKRPQLCMSTPNLASTPELETETERERELANELDCNGNSAKTFDGGHYATLGIKSNGNGDAHGGLPEPTPRKRLIQLKKKTAPAPPPDASLAMSADSISLASTTASITEMAPQPAPRISTPNPAPVTASSPIATPNLVEQLPPPLPVSAAPQLSSDPNPNPNQNQNVSKVLLNRTPTPEPRSLSSANEEEELEDLEELEDNNDAASKQADSGIGEPVATPLNSTSPSPEPEPDRQKENRKTQLESSSEDEEAIKVYNFKTSRETSLKTETEELQLPKATTLAELTVLTNAVAEEGATEEEEEDEAASEQPTPNSASELTSLSSWNYAVPISPPPDFSDARSKERGNVASSSPLNEIVDELSSIINQQRLDTLIRQAPEQPQIEAAKPNRLANFSIAAISNGCTTRSGSSSSSNSSSTATTPTTPKTIVRADSFQAVGQSGLGLRLRSSSQLSLNKLEIGIGNGSGIGSGGMHPRRSSSELSIAESPSLQSLELIKTILSNSRKNSLADSPSSPQPAQVQVQPKKSPSPSPSPSPVIVSPVSITPAAVPAPIPSPAPVASVRASPVEESLAVSPASTATPATLPAFSPSPTSPASFLESERKVASSPAPAPSTSTPVVAPSPSPIPPPSPVAVAASPPAAAPASSPAPSVSPTPAPAPVPAAKPLPPTYRYSGPPSINFATWSERPKSQVAIKNEGDYIFGGATTAAPPTKPVAAPAKLTIEVASPILRMGIPRKEYHVPITVKPLRDASEDFEREQPNRETRAKPAQKEELPSRESLMETIKEPNREPMRDSQRDLQGELLREPQRDSVKPSTLPRPAKSNRFTLPAQAHSTLTSSTATTTSTTTTTMLNAASSNSLPRPLSTLERKAKAAEPVAVPFGQNTLRRTGFKERMLAKELEEKEQALRVRVSVNGMATPTPTVTATATAFESKPMIIRSSKLELKLQQQPPEVAASVAAPTGSTSKVATPDVATPKVAAPDVATSKVATPDVATPRVSTPDVAAPMLQVKLRPTSQVAAKVATSSTPPPPPVAPPAPAKAKPMRNMGVAAPDPRTQLLDAIRNFKREELNRA